MDDGDDWSEQSFFRDRGFRGRGRRPFRSRGSRGGFRPDFARRSPPVRERSTSRERVERRSKSPNRREQRERRSPTRERHERRSRSPRRRSRTPERFRNRRSRSGSRSKVFSVKSSSPQRTRGHSRTPPRERARSRARTRTPPRERARSRARSQSRPRPQTNPHRSRPASPVEDQSREEDNRNEDDISVDTIKDIADFIAGKKSTENLKITVQNDLFGQKGEKSKNEDLKASHKELTSKPRVSSLKDYFSAYNSPPREGSFDDDDSRSKQPGPKSILKKRGTAESSKDKESAQPDGPKSQWSVLSDILKILEDGNEEAEAGSGQEYDEHDSMHDEHFQSKTSQRKMSPRSKQSRSPESRKITGDNRSDRDFESQSNYEDMWLYSDSENMHSNKRDNSSYDIQKSKISDLKELNNPNQPETEISKLIRQIKMSQSKQAEDSPTYSSPLQIYARENNSPERDSSPPRSRIGHKSSGRISPLTKFSELDDPYEQLAALKHNEFGIEKRSMHLQREGSEYSSSFYRSGSIDRGQKESVAKRTEPEEETHISEDILHSLLQPVSSSL